MFLQYDTGYLPLCPVANLSVFVSFWDLAPLLVCFAISWRNPNLAGDLGSSWLWLCLMFLLMTVSMC